MPGRERERGSRTVNVVTACRASPRAARGRTWWFPILVGGLSYRYQLLVTYWGFLMWRFILFGKCSDDGSPSLTFSSLTSTHTGVLTNQGQNSTWSTLLSYPQLKYHSSKTNKNKKSRMFCSLSNVRRDPKWAHRRRKGREDPRERKGENVDMILSFTWPAGTGVLEVGEFIPTD